MIQVNWALLSQIILAAEEAKQPSIIYFDWTIFYQAGLFILLMIFLGKALFAPMLKVFEAREQAHLAPEMKAKDLHAAASQADEAYYKIREEAFATGERIRAELIKDAAESQKAIISAAKTNADGLVDAARRRMDESRAYLKVELPKKADALAAMLADRLLGR